MGRAFEVRKQSMQKTAEKKSKVYARYGKEIYQVAKNSSDPEVNLELKRVIEKARKDQVPKEIIDRAIDKAKGGSEENYIATRYEFFGPGGSLFIVECLTDNVTRTIANVRNCFTKTGGKSGSTLHLFEHKSIFSFQGITEDEVLEMLILSEIDVDDIEEEDDYLSIIGPATSYNLLKEALLENYPNLNLEIDEISWLPAHYQNLNAEEYEQYLRLLELLDDIDDVQRVYHNVSDEK